MSILLKRNETAGVVPSPEELVPGEIAINTADGALYTKKEDGSVVLVGFDSSLPAPTTVPWSSITGEPSSFTPSPHTHSPSDITGTAVITTDFRLSDSRDPNPHSHDWYSTDIQNKPLIDNNGDNWRFVASAQTGSVEMISHSANYFVRVSEGGPAQVIGTLVQGPISITNSGNTGVNGSITFPDATVQTTAYTGLIVHNHTTSEIDGLDSVISSLQTGKQDAGDYALANHQHDKNNFNTAIGTRSLISLTTGVRNTAVGVDSLQWNTTGLNNTAIGTPALLQNIDGENNTAVGAWACIFNTSGYENTAIGSAALANNVNGSRNVGIGAACLSNTTTGVNNTGLGSHAGVNNITGSGNIVIGPESGPVGGDFNGCIVIGAGALADRSGQLVLGSPAYPLNTSLSVGEAGTAEVLPSQPLGYLQVLLNNVLIKIPYYRE